MASMGDIRQPGESPSDPVTGLGDVPVADGAASHDEADQKAADNGEVAAQHKHTIGRPQLDSGPRLKTPLNTLLDEEP